MLFEKLSVNQNNPNERATMVFVLIRISKIIPKHGILLITIKTL